MKRLVKILIAGTAIATLPLSLAYADGSTSSPGSEILNGQVSLHTVKSSVGATIDNVGGDTGATSVAAGNTLDVVTMNDTNVQNSQYTASVNIFSDLGAQVSNVGGSVGIQGQAICNSASISTDPSLTKVNSTQQCDANDPDSRVNANVSAVNGDVSVTSLGAGNTFEEDTNAPSAPTNVAQINHSAINSSVIANVQNVGGTVAVSGSSIGNSAEIIHYSTN